MRAPLLAVLVLGMALAGCTGGNPPGPTGTTAPPAMPVHVVMNTSMGDIRLVLFADKTPVTVQSFVNLSASHFYDGTRFHRVIKDFMDQGGDPLSKDPSAADRWGTGGPGFTIEDEFPCKDGFVSHKVPGPNQPSECASHGGLVSTFDVPGVLAMANTGQTHTGGSQWFITAAKTNWLDGHHTIFGAVEGGLDVVFAINATPTDDRDRPLTDVVVNRVTVQVATA
jgi:cyclophilin family peptidyl-prolyl cis-trans isomerase